MEDLNAKISESSTLLDALRNVYLAMNGQGTPHFIINNHTLVSLQTGLKKLGMLGKPVIHGTFQTLVPTLRPYHGLLLMFDAEQVIKNLLPHSNPLLIRFIKTVNPTRSFEQLQTILDCSISQIYRLAAHLHFWSQAKIIQTLSTRNVYVLSDSADFSKLEEMSIDFASRFAPLNMVSLLSDMSIPIPYHAIIPSKEVRQIFLEALSYLLQHEIVLQLHMFIILCVPEDIVEKAVSNGYPKEQVRGSFVISNPSKPTKFESECIKLMKESRSNPIIRELFGRLISCLI
jgi:nitrogen permease regulator 3-like protein